MKLKSVFINNACLLVFLSCFNQLVFTESFAGEEKAETTIKPWAGYYWPVLRKEECSTLYENLYETGGPLDKYDRAFSQVASSSSMQWELQNHRKAYGNEYSPWGVIPNKYNVSSACHDVGWEGHCHAWSPASMNELQPTTSRIFNSVSFGVGDLKGLLTEAWDANTANWIFVEGDARDKKLPENAWEFHNTLTTYIRERDQPVVMDINDASNIWQIWNYPVYGYEMKWTESGRFRYYTTTLYAPSDTVEPDTIDNYDYNKPGSGPKPLTFTCKYIAEDMNNDGIFDEQDKWTWYLDTEHPENSSPYFVEWAWYSTDLIKKNPYIAIENVHQIMDSDFGEPNDSFSSAYGVTCGSSYSSSIIHSFKDVDYYKVVSGGSGTLTVTMTPPSDKDYDLYLYNSSEQELSCPDTKKKNNGAQESCSVSVTGGQTYYVKVIGKKNDKDYSSNFSATPYTFNVTCPIGTCSGTDFGEPNDGMFDAYPVSCGSSYSAKICSPDVDYYKVVPSGSGTLTVTMTPPPDKDYDLYLYHTEGREICSSTRGKGAQESCSVPVAGGQTYYIQVVGKYGDFSTTSAYTFTVTCPSGCEPLHNPDNLGFEWSACNGWIDTKTPKLRFVPYATDSTLHFLELRMFSGGSCSGSPIHTSGLLAAKDLPYAIPSSAGLQDGKTYSWQARAKGNGTTTCDSAWSDCCSMTVNLQKRHCDMIQTPSAVSPPASTSAMVYTTTPTLAWTDVASESGYEVKIFRGIRGDDCKKEPLHTSGQLPANTTSYTVPASAGLQFGQSYSWSVQAIGNGTTYCDSNSSCFYFLVFCTDFGMTNNSFSSALPLLCDEIGAIYSKAKICSPTDGDYYSVVPNGGSTLAVTMKPPSDKNYDLYLYDSTQQQICSSTKGTGVEESCSVPVTGGQMYYIKMAGSNGDFSTTSPYSFTIQCSTGCAPPSTPSLTAPSSAQSGSTYTVSWTSSSGATRYQIQESTDSSFSNPSSSYVTGTSKTFSHSVTSCTKYYYRVAAEDEPCKLISGWSNVATTEVCPSCAAPSTPSLTAPSSAQSGSTYIVSWTSSSGATRYQIQEAADSSFTDPSSSYVTGTSKTFSHSVASCTQYYYRVAAENEPCKLTSGWSNVATTEVCASCTPPSPPSLTAPSSAQSGSGYTVSWTSSSGATRYQIQEAADSSFTNPSSSYVTGTSKTFSHSVTSCTKYYYRVAAENEPCKLTSGWSNVANTQVCPSCPTPGIPTNPSPPDGTRGIPTELTLSWTACANTASYNVYFDTFPNPTTYAGNTSNPSFSRSGLKYNTTYYWQVVAQGPCGNFSPGPVWSFTTATGCTYSISPQSQSFGPNGGTGSVSVATQTGCSWTGASNSTWVTITSGSGSGNGTVNFTVAANTSTSSRTGTLTIAGQTFTVSQGAQGGQKPNLKPHQPAGWSDKIVLSKGTGTNTDSSPLLPTDTLYLDFAVINDSEVAINSTFYAALYIDGSLKNTWHWESLNAHNYCYVEDYWIGSLSAGTHILRIVADSTSTIDENTENDNEYTKAITVQGLPNLTPYQPKDWSNKIVVSNVMGATIDTSPLKTTDTLYANWAVVNQSSVDISDRFYVSLYVDGKFSASWYVDSLEGGYYVYLTDHPVGMLGAGPHTLTVVADSNGQIAESSETDNEYTKTITVEVKDPNEKLPNLTLYQPAGWSDALVVSNSKGSRTDSDSLTSKDSLYINWAVLNDGPIDTPKGFSVDLYIDGVLQNTWTNSSALKSNYYRWIKDYSIGSLYSGDHFLVLVVDSKNEISESDEEDNFYLKVVTVKGPIPFVFLPNLRPYQPEGWSDKIVISTSRKTFKDSSSFTTRDTLYIDWAVISEWGASDPFAVNLCVDGVVVKTWKVPGLEADGYYAVRDYPVGKLSARFHTLTIVIDPDGVIGEEDKGDNEYNKTIEVVEIP